MIDSDKDPPSKKRCVDCSEDRKGANNSAETNPPLLLPPSPIVSSAKDFILGMFESSRAKKSDWNKLSLEWHRDPEVAMVALLSGAIRTADLPESTRDDRDFMLKAVQEKAKIWFDLPDQFADDQAFAEAVPEFSRELAIAVFDRFPVLRANRDIWLKVIDSKGGAREVLDDDLYSKLFPEDLFELLQNNGPDSIRGDSEIMEKAARCCSRTLSLADESLFNRKKFVESVLEGNDLIGILKVMPDEIQSKWSELVAQRLRRGMPSNDTFTEFLRLSSQINPTLWENRRVVLSWFSGGSPFFDDHSHRFPDEWREDKEIFLLIAEKSSPPSLASYSFSSASPKLLRDKSFMLKAVEYSPQLFFHISPKLCYDFDMVVTALAGSNPYYDPSSMAHCYLRRQRSDPNSFEKVRTRVQGQLEAHNIFTKLILPAMSHGSQACPLTLLNQEMGYKKLIAEYLDVPLGMKLSLARRALRNLPDADEIRDFCGN